MRKKIMLLLFAVVVSNTIAYCFNGRGHMVVASIAYSQLSDEQKVNVTELLKNHPDYKTLWKGQYQQVHNDMDLGLFLMMRASTWPDEIRDSDNVNHDFHRPQWHYVTYEMRFPNSHVKTLPDPKEVPNVVWAIDYAKSKANNQQLGKAERAMYLSWLIHLIGDIHQPLHCGSLFNSTYPTGDLGGNIFFVIVDDKETNLHSVWDASLGTGNKYVAISSQAGELQSTHSKAGVTLTHNPTAWSLESFNILVKKAIQNGKLEGTNKKNHGIVLPDGYIDEMKEIQSERGTWGGYRLGKAIQGLKIQNVPDADEDEE